LSIEILRDGQVTKGFIDFKIEFSSQGSLKFVDFLKSIICFLTLN